MATVQKKPRRLPQLPGSKENDADVKNNGKSGGSKGDTAKKQELPPPARRRDLPPLRRGVKRGGPDTKSLMEMGRKSPPEVGQRSSLTATHNAKSCLFYIDNDYTFSPIKMVIHPKKHRKLDTVARDLSVRMKSLPFGVRSIYTPRGQHKIHNLEDLTQDGHYVCSSNRSHAHGMDVARVHSKFVWHHLRPDSGRRILNDLLKDSDLQGAQQRAGFRPGYDLSSVYTRVPPKKTTVMKNGEPDIRHTVLMNRRTAQTYEQVLLTLSELFGFAVRKLYTIDGILIDGLQKMLAGPDVLVAAGTEAFIHLNMDYGNQSRTRSHMSSIEDSSRVNIQSRLQTRRDRLAKTKGRWRVTIRTNALPSAGTQAQVTITVYGNKGNSGAITLGHGDGTNFQPGQVDDFTISVGNVGDIYKVRLAHDNTGDFPGWLCDEVYMRDLDTQEELTFSCRRWLARDEDDQEITRELAVKRPGEPILPLIKYQIDVVTGDVWGGGTEANIYLTIYGDRGDTGVRQLYTETKGVYFKQGQLDSFEVEAVSLGHLKRIIIGHDGTGPGSGWFLDKVVIREPPFRTNQECVFYCGKWLDEGEDDGKIVRELRVQDEYMDDILEKRNWEIEKWKYEKDCQVMLYSLMTAKALRLNTDLTVDGIGEDREKTAVFNVILKKPMKPMFASAANPSHYLAIDNGRITGLGKGGPYCEFRVRVQQDRTTLFESVKNALQFLTIEADGTTGEVRGILDKEPAKRFYVYAKGCFRHKGVIMFSTSQLQAINIVREDNSLTGRGKRGGPQAHFRVHKVGTGGIRMFESVANPGHYIRLKDGKIDCLGSRDEESHFLVLRHRDKGYVTLQSATQRGLFLGMTTDGRVHTTIDTGVRNIWLFPEVVEWGMPKTESTTLVEEEIMERVRKDLTPDAIVESPRVVKQYAEGDWSIHVSTITSLTNADVALVAYGDKGNSGQIILGAPPGRPVFQDGNEDEFRANLAKIGKLFKIRLELIAKSSTKQPSWQVKEVRMQDLNTNEILRFNYDRWLSREEDDGEIMRELPVQRPGENVLPVHNYMVTVYTGKELGAETDAAVYITVHGERGDWGKRYLIHSNNNKKFRTGQVDVFYVEAVSLGHLQRCVIGHDGTGAGEGWYLEQVVIKEHDTATEEYLFPCHRWLDSSLEDQRIERALMVKDAVEDQKTGTDSSGSYKLEVITGKESDAFNGGHVHITLYGDRGKSDQIPLRASDSNIKVFEPENIDQFTIDTPDLGMLYKVRVGRDDSDRWLRWYLEEVRLTDIKRDEKIVLSFNRWLARDMDDGDLCRELPVLRPGKDILLLKQYVVQVYTGDHWGASTDANVFITMHGTRGDSGKRLLHKSSNNRVKFRRGQVDTFDFDVVDLEEFTSVLISHDGRGHGAGIFIDKVIIKEKDAKNSNVLYVFPCGRWLDDHEDNCVTERTLRMIDVIDTNTIKTEISKNLKKSNGVWSLTVKTSNVQKAATTSKVYVSVYGTQGHSDKIPLTLPDIDVNNFTAGAESQFQISTGNIGEITKIRLQHDNSGSNPDFRVDYVKMMDKESGEQLVFYIDRWLALGQDDGNICREIPVVRKGIPSLAVLRYIVAVVTGSYKDAGIDGEVSINLIGTDGDTGLRKLTNAISKNPLPWQSEQTDIYMLEAVSVGKIKKIELSVISATQTGRWYVQQVNIAEGARAASMYVGYCHSWIMANQSQVTEFIVSDVHISTILLDSLESIPKGLDRPVRSKGRWTVYVQTGTQNDSGTKEKVGIVLCGLKGESEVVCINSRDELNPGSFVKLEAKVPDIALLFKVRLFFIDKHVGSSWFMSKMKLKDQDTGEELHFEYNESLKSTNENPEGAIELPVIRPDLAPLKEKNYIVSVKTGNFPRAETTGHVFCNLIGQWGSSGQRLLSVSNLKEMFRTGQIDEFTVTCIELGDIQKVIIGHDRIGRGQGWYCESVYVKAAEESMTIFPCERWLDTGCHDRKLSTELFPLSKFPLPYTVPTKYLKSKEGEWNIHVTTAGLDKLPMLKTAHKSGDISIVVYGSLAVKGPIELTNEDSQGPVNLIEPWKTVHFYNIDFGNIGEIQKIRVSSGYEGDTNALWTIAKVVIEDQMSHDQLTFDFRGKVGEVGGDIRKEMPLLKPDGANRKIVQYYIEVHTGEEEINSSTNANVFITLYGLNSDSGRRHLIHSKNTQKRFQMGQPEFSKVDKFVLEAVDLGDFEKLVVAKGPGKPWLLDKIVIKKGQYAPEEHIFMFGSWIGDKYSVDREIEETLKLTATIPSQVAIPIEEAVDLQPSKGSWTMESVTGGRRGPDSPLDMVIVFCGQQGESSQIALKSNRDNPFQIGQSDIFKLKYAETIGNIRKIRIGFKDQIVTKAWFVRKMTFEDNDNHDIFWVDFNDWIAIDHKLDGWKEFPVPWPAVHVSPVVCYLVTVQTGDVHTNAANPNIYVYIYGDQGGTGCRLLKHSMSNTEIFKKSQVDVFEIEAVHLGELVKLIIGHNNQAKDAGWYIERVLVQESQDADKILFECNRWLDASHGDGLNEHTLFPENFGAQQFDNKNNNKEEPGEIIVPLISKKPSSPVDIKETAHVELEEKAVTEKAPSLAHPEKKRDQLELEEVTPMPSSQGMKYSVTVTTGGDPGAGVSIPIVIVLYGEKGHSKPTLIGHATDFSFSVGNTDNFEVIITEDIGPMYKVRLGFQGEENHPEWYSDISKAPVWIVDKLTIRNEINMEVYEFEAPIQVKITKHQDFWQEIPVKKSDTLQVFQYVVCMYTSEESKSVPDDNVYLQIFGECGDTGYRRLMASKTNTQRFHKGNKDVFEIRAVDLGKLEKIQIKLDGSSPQSGWQLGRVVIKESEETTIQYVFKCERWLNGDSGEDGAQQTLMLSEVLVSDEEDKSVIVSGYQWKVVVVTGDEDDSCDQWPVELFLYTQDGHYQSVVIGDNFDSKFSPGALYSFNVTLMEDIEDLYKIRLGFYGGNSEMEWIHDFSKAPSWFIEQISLTDDIKGKLYEIKTATWLKMDTYQDFWREQPIRQANGKTAPLYQYHVEVYTGNQSKEVGTNASILVCIYGEKGDTGFRRLMASKTNAIKFEKGNCDIFELNAVDLGVLTKVSITCSVPEVEPGWYLEKVVVKEKEKSLTKYVFKCNKWFGVEGEEIPASHTFTLTELLAEEDQEENISGNDWTVWCVTGSYEGDEKDNAVDLILYGDKGHSEPVIIGGQEDFKFNTDQVDVFEAKVEGEVGKLYKVRVGFHGNGHEVPWYNNYHLAPSWFIESMRLKDESSGIEYELEAGVSVQVEKYTDFWRELPVVNMDYMLNAHKYHVEIYCGEKVREDVNVSVQIYGQRGDTGLRRLMDSKTNKDKFQGRQKDVFEIRAVDLGELIKVKVTHDGHGPGSGMLLDKVVVKETEDSLTQYVFECGKWLEDGTKGHDVEIILPLSDITEMTNEEQKAEPEQKAQAGQWKVLITTCGEEDSGTDSNVTLTICGDADSSEPISLGSSQLGHFYSGNTDEFEIFLDPEVIGQIRKIRLEHDNSVNPWQVEKVVMKNMHDGSQLEFPINKWLTLDNPGSDIVVEIPTTRHDWPEQLAVRDYVVSTLTGDGFGSGTDAAVYINLIGTLGDTGKRYLIHSLEGNEDKFQSGQTDTFIVQAVDIGRLMNVQIGHHGKGPGSGWFLKTVTVKESIQSQERYVFKCEQWLSSEKNDGLTERLLAQDFIDKSQAEISFKKVIDNVDDGEHIKSNTDLHNVAHQDKNRQFLEEGHIVNENHKPENFRNLDEHEKLVRKHTDKENHGFEQSNENNHEKADNDHNGIEGRPKTIDSKVENGSAKQGASDGKVEDELSHKVKREGSITYRVNKDAK